MATSTFPFPGIKVTEGQFGITVLRLHFDADPDKGLGEKIYCADIKRWLSPWAKKEYDKSTSKSFYLQEYEIDASARLGQRVFEFEDDATLEDSFPIPPHWTRYFSLDPHPSVPHAMLWVAMDPWGDMWAYRELWPSKSCWRYENGILLGLKGPCPEEDNRFRVREYVESLFYLESAENPENEWQDKRFYEVIRARVIDYAARAFGKGTSDDPEQLNYQQRFESQARAVAKDNHADFYLRFDDAKKNRGAGEETVNAWLKPREVDDNQDGWRRRSKLHIFKDRCPELIYELKNNRRQQLSAVQAEKMDPTGKPIEVRKHMTDNLLYICAANPRFVPQRDTPADVKPLVDGIAY